jgi:hypothetical protein
MFYSEILKIKNNNKANEEELVRIKSKLYDIEKKKSSLENADGIKSY